MRLFLLALLTTGRAEKGVFVPDVLMADLNHGVLIANRATASTWEQFVMSPV